MKIPDIKICSSYCFIFKKKNEKISYIINEGIRCTKTEYSLKSKMNVIRNKYDFDFSC